MWIEFVRQHGIYRPGQEVDHPHPGVADVLVRRGIATLAGDVVAKLSEAADKTAGGPKRPTPLKGNRR